MRRYRAHDRPRYRDRFAPKAEDDGFDWLTTTTLVKTLRFALPGRKRRPTGRFYETAAPTGASIFRAADMMAARSDFKTSRHYLAGLPQTQLPASAGQSIGRVHHNRDFLRGRSGGWFWHHERPTTSQSANVMAGVIPSPLAYLRLTSASTSTSSVKPAPVKRHCCAI